MRSITPLPTQFAPAERATTAELDADVAQFASYALIQEFFAAVPDIFLVLNEQRQIVFSNRALLELLGLQAVDDVVGKRPGEALSCVHASESAGGCGTTEFCRECGAVRAILSSLRGCEDVQECRVIRTDGDALDLRVRTQPMLLNDKRYSLFAVSDISHEKRRRVLERIFFHDILNTAGGMLGVAELLRDGSVAEVADFKDTVFLLAASLVDEIKAQQILSAAETGELTTEHSRINSVTLLCEVRHIYVNHEVSMGRLLEIAPDAELVMFVSDKTLVRRVIGNMVKNALEACKPGQTVTISCHAHTDGPEFSVHNPNPMPRDVQLQVFQRSFSTKGVGRGLGTYSMKLLSERFLQGKVYFTTSAAEGTTFFARYPSILTEPPDDGETS